MVKLDYVKGETFDATIISTDDSKRLNEVIPAEHLPDFRAKMRLPNRAKDMTPQEIEDYKDDRLARKVLLIRYEMSDGKEREEFVTIPLASGIGSSNMRKLMMRNENLPINTEEWAGKVIKLKLNDKGYPEIAY